MPALNCQESLSSLCLHVFLFYWCVAHVGNMIQILSLAMTWFALWTFKTSRSKVF